MFCSVVTILDGKKHLTTAPHDSSTLTRKTIKERCLPTIIRYAVYSAHATCLTNIYHTFGYQVPVIVAQWPQFQYRSMPSNWFTPIAKCLAWNVSNFFVIHRSSSSTTKVKMVNCVCDDNNKTFVQIVAIAGLYAMCIQPIDFRPFVLWIWKFTKRKLNWMVIVVGYLALRLWNDKTSFRLSVSSWIVRVSCLGIRIQWISLWKSFNGKKAVKEARNTQIDGHDAVFSHSVGL